VSANIELGDNVRSALERDPRILDPIDIAVSADGITVTLRGTVRSIKQRRAAVEDAKSTEGVREVIDDLRVRWLEDDVWDDALRGAALQSLIWDAEVPAETIEVEVKDGWVTLKGQVKHQFQSDAAFEDMARIKGVGGITNEIKVISTTRNR
jgi:osmotically-inducible protein OsmY